MNIIIAASLCFFLAGTCYFTINWFSFFRRQPNPSVEDRFLAFVILIVATIFWVLLIPFYCFKLLANLFFSVQEAKKRSANNATEAKTSYSDVLRTKYKVKSQI